MRILIISGSHPRHNFIAEHIIQFGFETTQIRVKREPLISEPLASLTFRNYENYEKHFRERAIAEEKNFNVSNNKLRNHKFLEIDSLGLNSLNVVEFVGKVMPDLCIIFGTGLIKNPLLSVLPINTFNLHLGLSPWYRGAATLFWPFYLLEPQFAGITVHKITDKPDAGEIYHQAVPELKFGQGIHDVAVAAVKTSVGPLEHLIHLLEKNPNLAGIQPASTGRIWTERDFRAEHLELIYDVYNNRIVDHYLEGRLGSRTPKLLSVF